MDPKRLVIGNDLQSRRFVLDPKGDLKGMPFFRVAEGRAVYHKPFSLSLDLVDGRVGIFVSNDPRAFLLARDESSQTPRIPVFFVGRPRESLEELRDNAESLVFDPSASLDAGSDFSQVTFHLKRGGSHFDVIRPFFMCGLAGLLVCEESCPEDSDTLAASLVNTIVRGEPGTLPSSGREEAKRLLRWTFAASPGRARLPRCRLSGPGQQSDSRKRPRSARGTGTSALTPSTGAFFRGRNSAFKTGELPRLPCASNTG